MPPLPSGALVTVHGVSRRMWPSTDRHGSVPCWKKNTSFSWSPKNACFLKKLCVASSVCGLVMMYHGTLLFSPKLRRRLSPADADTPLLSSATLRRRSAMSWKRDLCEGKPMSKHPLGSEVPNRVP